VLLPLCCHNRGFFRIWTVLITCFPVRITFAFFTHCLMKCLWSVYCVQKLADVISDSVYRDQFLCYSPEVWCVRDKCYISHLSLQQWDICPCTSSLQRLSLEDLWWKNPHRLWGCKNRPAPFPGWMS